MGRTIFAAVEREESDAESVCGEFGGMRGEAGGDDSGDERRVGEKIGREYVKHDTLAELGGDSKSSFLIWES